MELFDSTKRSLYNILKDVQIGKIQLPDFQRGWIWDDYRIKGLLASIAKSFPIGAIMLLETGNEDLRFKTRYVESVIPDKAIKKPEELILDGQQRITSLYQTIFSNKIVKTTNERKQEIYRWYYINMKMALDGNSDLEEAIVSLNENRQITKDFGREITLDLSFDKSEYENLMFPVCMVDEFSDWRVKFEEFWDYDKERIKFINLFEKKVIKSFENYQIPVILLKKENTKEAVCQVFEKVNTGGVMLNVFELLTATYASDSFDLRENWSVIQSEFKKINILNSIGNTDFMQAVTLLSTYYKRIRQRDLSVSDERLPAVSCKKKDVLDLSLEEYQLYFSDIKIGYIKAAKLLMENYVFKGDDLPYTTQLIPLSAILSVLGDEAHNMIVKSKLMQWYWSGVFGELYGGGNETRYALDLVQVVDWIRGIGEIPKTIYEASFNPNRLYTLRTRNSAAYKGVYALIMKLGAQDFIEGKKIEITSYFDENIDIHHIFPKSWCEKQSIARKDYNSIINKTALSYKTNRMIGGEAPSKYLDKIEKNLPIDKESLCQVLKTHLIEPDLLFADDFNGFLEKRKIELLNFIGQLMGKQIDNTVPAVEIEIEEEDEEQYTEQIVPELFKGFNY